MTTSEYLLDNRAAAAQRRFGALSALFDDVTFRHIQALGIQRGWRCWEARAGGPSVPNWLAGRTGPDGHVLATDIDTSWIDGVAPHVEVRRHDLARDDLPPGAFDLIHARLVLCWIPQRDEALRYRIRAPASSSRTWARLSLHSVPPGPINGRHPRPGTGILNLGVGKSPVAGPQCRPPRFRTERTGYVPDLAVASARQVPCRTATARGYQIVFAALTAQQPWLRPNRTVSPAVYLYITALGANILNCRGSGGRLCREARR